MIDVTSKASPTGINLDFLRSGQQFCGGNGSDNLAPQPRDAEDDALLVADFKLSRDARALAFYHNTLTASAEAAAHVRAEQLRQRGLVNLDFLRSGGQFCDPLAENAMIAELMPTPRLVLDNAPVPKPLFVNRDGAASAFHATTSSAMQ